MQAPSSINQIYSTSLYNQEEKKEDNPFYALERLYETADKWKRDREVKNDNFLRKQAPHKPMIYSSAKPTGPYD